MRVAEDKLIVILDDEVRVYLFKGRGISFYIDNGRKCHNFKSIKEVEKLYKALNLIIKYRRGK